MNFESLVGHINQVQDVLQSQAAHAVNLALTARNWLVGYYIVEFELDRQVSSQYYERMGLSKDKMALQKLAAKDAVQLSPNDILRDPVRPLASCSAPTMVKPLSDMPRKGSRRISLSANIVSSFQLKKRYANISSTTSRRKTLGR